LTVDNEMLELILAELTTMWRQPIAGGELAVWRRTLRPDAGASLDPEIAMSALLALKHEPQFESSRPGIAAFLTAYDSADKATDSDLPASTETVRTTLADCRRLLAGPKKEMTIGR